MEKDNNNKKEYIRTVEKEVVKEVIQNDDGTETVIYKTEMVEEKLDTADPDAFDADRVWVDDGTTSFADMDLTRRPKKRKRKDPNVIQLTRKERLAIIGAAYRHYLPIFLIVIGAFAFVGLIAWLWIGR